ncbi:hypothetical protein AA103196_1666 [Ameyamaea chiangmaiensis NBRC 103196]|uniref:Uncharacterized protein n=1 Tax=Ameyamaea chiangmaiensis TaxID=442969 RepID=A0A850PET9_9PROT|nr:hypothetical protein [Ameyamaea chiangmaiensis]MBS4074068.1 hypothetical protein [Ameyamaea chiangmaiensis]NVN40442.1 hypothetical protein [Ameyamaea chiangmaiensis]GBQ67367.1 hypothetical protein AA103196_1666 [Ameyamaea chiangmaiensis NBRC 103196]
MAGRNSGRSGGPRGGVGDIVRGMMLLGRGSASGMGFFGGTVDAFLNALAPQLAWQIVISVLMLAQSPGAMNLTKALLLLCGVLLPPVVTHRLAVLWGREDRWLRYATASLWCDWLTLFVFVVALMLCLALLSSLMAPALVIGIIIASKTYEFWLRWFVARTGLGLGGWQSLTLVLSVLFALLALDALALLLPPHYDAWHDLLTSLQRRGR